MTQVRSAARSASQYGYSGYQVAVLVPCAFGGRLCGVRSI